MYIQMKQTIMCLYVAVACGFSLRTKKLFSVFNAYNNEIQQSRCSVFLKDCEKKKVTLESMVTLIDLYCNSLLSTANLIK